MPFTFGFYNSSNHDRLYHAEQMSSIFDGIITDGVFQGIGDKMFTIPGTGLQVIVQTGRAWFNHTWSLNDTPYHLSIDSPDSILTRIDAVVLEVDHNIEVRANSLKVIKGIPSSSPKVPDLEPSSGAEKTQHLLATVTVKPNAQSITVQDISIKVGQGETPFVTSVIQQTDISQLYAAWQAKFEEDLASWKATFDAWFEHIQSVLSEEVITNLQRQITENKETFKEYLRIDQRATNLDAIQGTDDSKWISAKVFGTVGKLQDYGVVETRLTVKTQAGNPIPNLAISNIYKDMACQSAAKTDSDGVIQGYVKTSTGSKSLGVSGYADIVDGSITISDIPGSSVDKELRLAVRETLVVTTSKSIKYSPNVSKVDITLVGGGYAYHDQSTGKEYNVQNSDVVWGGDGGYVYTVNSMPFSPDNSYSVNIGKGAGYSSDRYKYSAPGNTTMGSYSSKNGANTLNENVNANNVNGKPGIQGCDGKYYGAPGGAYYNIWASDGGTHYYGKGQNGGGDGGYYMPTTVPSDLPSPGPAVSNQYPYATIGKDGTGGGCGGYLIARQGGSSFNITLGGSGVFVTKMTLKVS